MDERNKNKPLTLIIFFDTIEKRMSITYHKKIKKRKRKHGFLKRAKTKAGKRVVVRRRRKKRKEITVK